MKPSIPSKRLIWVLLLQDIWGNKEGLLDGLPGLVYLSREKRTNHSHHYKAGAMNVLVRCFLCQRNFKNSYMIFIKPNSFDIYLISILLFLYCEQTRVSGLMTNAPYMLNVDCDMYANNPKIVLHAMCLLLGSNSEKEIAFVQFSNAFYDGLKDDPYGNQWVVTLEVSQIFKSSQTRVFFHFSPNYKQCNLYHIQIIACYICTNEKYSLIGSVWYGQYMACGFSGLQGMFYGGTGCFHRRKVIYGLQLDNIDSVNGKKINLNFHLPFLYKLSMENLFLIVLCELILSVTLEMISIRLVM